MKTFFTKTILSIFILLISSWISYAQDIQTTFKAKEVITLFEQKTKEIQWRFPLPENQGVDLLWKEVPNSLASIRTFMATKMDGTQASLSINKGKINGSLSMGDQQIDIRTNTEGVIVIHSTQIHRGHCGSCQGTPVFDFSSPFKGLPTSSFTTDQTQGATDNVLRIYRLALPVTNEYFTSLFESSVERVREFWARIESQLNEMYQRDLSVRFEVVDDERLIIQTPEDPINPEHLGRSPVNIIQYSTSAIDRLITDQGYDVGIVIGKNSRLREDEQGRILGGVLGLAGVGTAYIFDFKANGIAVADIKTIAHELGHMFGAFHTHSVNVNDSIESEPGEGQSVMSYGTPMNFFSLVSIIKQVKPILYQMPYFSDRERRNRVGTPFRKVIEGYSYWYDNYPYGEVTQNRPPVLHKESIKESYVLPKNTFFQFTLSATDPDGHTLLYMANQADTKDGTRAPARFLTYGASEQNQIRFQTQYVENRYNFILGREGLTEVPYSTPGYTGEFLFWLAARDAQLQPQERRVTTADIAQTRVIIREGKPFKLTNTFEREYNAGDRIDLHWDVDNNIFENNSKVRILLSKDFGKTFPIVLADNIANDGQETIVLPDIEVGKERIKTAFSEEAIEIPAGVIKVEVIDHIAYAVSHTRPYSIMIKLSNVQGVLLGGFEVHSSGLSFVNLPQEESITVNCDELKMLSDPNLVKAVSERCPDDVRVNYTEVGRKSDCVKHTFKRVWTATDQCNHQIVFEQNVEVVPVYRKLNFVGELPKNKVVTANEIPEPESELPTEYGCENKKTSFTQTESITAGIRTLIRTWQVSDDCDTIQHIQTIQVLPEIEVFNGVFDENNYLYFKGLESYKNPSLLIFNQMGQLVFKQDDYQQRMFKGHSNMGVLFSKNKLVSGVYYYVLQYQYEDHKFSKSGFLMIK